MPRMVRSSPSVRLCSSSGFLAICLVVGTAGFAAAAAADAATGSACGADAAYSRLRSFGVVGPYAEFNVALSKFSGLAKALKTAAAHKAIVAPTNNAMQNFYAQHRIDTTGLYNKPHFPVDLSPSQKRALTGLIKLVVVTRTAFETRVRVVPGDCTGAYLASTHDVNRALNALVSHGRPQGLVGTPYVPKNGTAANTTNTTAAGQGRRLHQSASNPQTLVNLGVGYNVFIANPYTTGSSGVDPGILSDAIFAITSTSQYSSSVVATCDTSASSLTSYSASSTQQSMAKGLGLSLSYEQNSFTANSQWTSAFNTTNTASAFTFTSSAQVWTTLYSMQSLGEQTLSASFIQDVTYIYDAVNLGINTDALNSYLGMFINSYGTHYISNAYAGAISSVLTQMTANSAAEYQNNGYSFTANAQATYGATFGVSGSSSNTQASQVAASTSTQSTTTQLVPSTVSVPFMSSGCPAGTEAPCIDCSAWTNALNAQTSFATVLSVNSLQPIIDIFTIPGLNWPSGWTTAGLTNVYNTLSTTFEQCGAGNVPNLPTGCVGVSSACNPGSFLYSPQGYCFNCYEAGQGYNACSQATTYYPPDPQQATASCDATAGSNPVCNCANSGWQGADCATPNPGTCSATYSTPHGAHCITDGFCNYGYTTNVQTCDSDAFGCNCYCTNRQSGSEEVAGPTNSCYRGNDGNPSTSCPGWGTTCYCPSSCS